MSINEYIIIFKRNRIGNMYRGNWVGDPGVTYNRDFAKRYKTKMAAKSALTQIRNMYSRSFPNAKIVEA